MRAYRWQSRQAHLLCEATSTADPVQGIRLLAAELIDLVGFEEPPFDPRVMASFRNILDIRSAAMQSDARLIPNAQGLLIEVNESHSRGKQNFSADHEISHTLMPDYAGEPVSDERTGQFPSGREEELLCDIGAAALLLNSRWLHPRAQELGQSLGSLQSLAEQFDASLEATARQLTDGNVWPVAFIVWEDGLRKEHQISLDQGTLPGLEAWATITPNLRVSRRYASASFQEHGYYIPINKSAPESSLIVECGSEMPYAQELVDLDFGPRHTPVRLSCESWYVPYRKNGETRRRVISLVEPPASDHLLREPHHYQLEAFS